MTAHRFIGMAERALENEDEQAQAELDYDVCIMDETSMTDTWLMYKVLKYLPEKATVLLVGDIDQLASVGPGNVLGDLIDSHVIPVSRLTKVYRQGDGSGVAAAARNIISGQKPSFTSDFRFTPIDDPTAIAQEVLRRARDYHQQGIDITEIQVLSPMHKSEIGVTALNNKMQSLFNPPKGGLEVKIFDYTYRKGDKVLQMKNNFKKDIVNGDIGYITRIYKDDEDTYIAIQFDDRHVELKQSEAENLSLAYAMTIHKSQGGQFQKVIMPMHPSQYIMLHRNIFYTGVTRAKEEVDIIGVKRAVNISVDTEKNSIRQTGLKTALITHFKGADVARELYLADQTPKASTRSAKSVPMQSASKPTVDTKSAIHSLISQLNDVPVTPSVAPLVASTAAPVMIDQINKPEVEVYETDYDPEEGYMMDPEDGNPDYDEYEALFSGGDSGMDMEP